MTLKIVDKLDEAQWLDFVNSHPDGNIFHTPYMLRAFKNTKDYSPLVLAAVDSSCDEILALLLSVEIKVGDIPGLKKLASRFVVFGGPLNRENQPDNSGLSELLVTYDNIMKKRGLYTEVRNYYDVGKIKGVFEQRNYKYEDHLNYFINLQRDPEAIFHSFSENRRRNIRKAMTEGLEIEEVADLAKVSLFYDILKETYSRIRVPIPDSSLFESLCRELVPMGLAKLLMAKQKNNYMSATTLLLYKGVMVYWYSGTRAQFFSFYPNEFLIWQAIKWGTENGYRTFDFGGAGRPDEKYGVRDFKARFGGELVNYGRYVKVYHPVALKISKIGYWLYRKFL
jgi:hypothetical protein